MKKRSSPHSGPHSGHPGTLAGIAFCAGLTATLVLTLPTLRGSMMQMMGATMSFGSPTSPGAVSSSSNASVGSCSITWLRLVAGDKCSTTTTGSSSAGDSECSDGADNDGDLRVDFPNDPGCLSSSDDNEEMECSDGDDNDSIDGADYPTDPGCSSASDDNEADKPQCSDRADNDRNGMIDFGNDPSCTSARDNTETATSGSTSSAATSFVPRFDRSAKVGSLCSYCLELQDAKVQSYCKSSDYIQAECKI